MRVSRIFVDQPLAPGQCIVLDERAARYIGQVLRLRPGQQLVLFNGDGKDWQAEIASLDRRHGEVTIGEVVAIEPAASLSVHLGIGISRGERMDYALQKSVELGVGEITPLATLRSVVQLKPDRVEQRVAHWRGVVLAACEQSGRSRVPTLHPPTTLDDWLERTRDGLLLHHAAATGLPGLAAPASPVPLLIGPEGGLDEGERARATAAGYTAVRLGPRVLRTETAPLAALAAIQALWGDFR